MCVRLLWPCGCSPPGSSVHGVLQRRNTGVGCRLLLQGSSQRRGRARVSCLFRTGRQTLPLAGWGSPVSSCSFPRQPRVQRIPRFGVLYFISNFPGGSVVKNPPATQEMWVRSLGQEDPLEKEMATHSSILAWRIPRTEEPGGRQSMGSQRVGHD